jgi:hypothetical protein
MASSAEVQVYIDSKFKQCVAALQTIALIADTGTQEHKDALKAYYDMGDTPTGWRVAEAMREVANDCIGSLPLEEDLTIYKRAMESMAAQFIHPRMTALEMAKTQLAPRERKCAKCSGSGMVQRWTGEYVECDACNARGF